MKIISKKIDPEYFNAVSTGAKRFELRKDEDDVQVGDVLILEEWVKKESFPGGGVYTGAALTVYVSYVLRDVPQFGLEPGYCIIGW